MSGEVDPTQRIASPVSSGRSSPKPSKIRQRDEDSLLKKDKGYRRYASTVERVLSQFDTSVEEWADYITFLGRLLKALSLKPSGFTEIPRKHLIAKRLSQCLNPILPSGVHQKTLEVYAYVFSTLGKEDLAADLGLYLPGLSPVLSFAALSVKPNVLTVFENHIIPLKSSALRPALKSICLALLPGLEEENSDEFDRTIRLLAALKRSIARDSTYAELDGEQTASDEQYFWQCLFLASITSPTRRSGALAYLVRNLPQLGNTSSTNNIQSKSDGESDGNDAAETLSEVIDAVVSPEPGLLVRCFCAGLQDERLLIQRGFLDLLVTNLPLNSHVLQEKVISADLEKLVIAATSVVARKDMSLNRRLWSWFLGPEPTPESNGAIPSPRDIDIMSPYHNIVAYQTMHFEKFGLKPLISGISAMIASNSDSPVNRTKALRICLSLMDRWEIGALVIPKIFLPAMRSVWTYQNLTSSQDSKNEVLRSANMFFDGVESSLIWSEIYEINKKALDCGPQEAREAQSMLEMVLFMVTSFNIREEEMQTVHMPLIILMILVQTIQSLESSHSKPSFGKESSMSYGFKIVSKLLELVPPRALIGPKQIKDEAQSVDGTTSAEDISCAIHKFYRSHKGNIDIGRPFTEEVIGRLILDNSFSLVTKLLNLNAIESYIELDQITTLLKALIKKGTATRLSTIKGFLAILLHGDEEVEELPNAFPKSFAITAAKVAVIEAIFSTPESSTWISAQSVRNVLPPLVREIWPALSASRPKHNVEAVRAIWNLYTLCQERQLIDSIIVTLMIQEEAESGDSFIGEESARKFTILWAHSQTITASMNNKQASSLRSKAVGESILKATPVESFLERPLMLLLDALDAPKCSSFSFVVGWLQSLSSLASILELLIHRLSLLHSIVIIFQDDSTLSAKAFEEDPDGLQLCCYYLQSIHNVIQHANDSIWDALDTTSSFSVQHKSISTHLDFLADVSIKLLQRRRDFLDADADIQFRITQVSLALLRQLMTSPMSISLSSRSLDAPLIVELNRSIQYAEHVLQKSLMDAILAIIRPLYQRDAPAKSSRHQRTTSRELLLPTSPIRSVAEVEEKNTRTLPPSSLLDCILMGLKSSRTRPVLENWTTFLSNCLIFYGENIFQILLPLIGCFCDTLEGLLKQVDFAYHDTKVQTTEILDPTITILLNGLEQTLAAAHNVLVTTEATIPPLKSPEPQQGSFFGSMVGAFGGDAAKPKTLTANNRLTVLLCFKDAIRVCYSIWAWGDSSKDSADLDVSASASYKWIALRLRNRTRRIFEHLFTAEALECLETLIELWQQSLKTEKNTQSEAVTSLLSVLESSRPKIAMPAIFNAIYSRTNPSALEPNRTSSLTSDLSDITLATFLVAYLRALDDDAMDEVWNDCVTFLKDLLANPMPHRQTLPSLIEFTVVLGQKVDNTTFGEQRKLRRELGDLFVRLLTVTLTIRPMGSITEVTGGERLAEIGNGTSPREARPGTGSDSLISVLAKITPNLSRVLLDSDRVSFITSTISTHVITPILRAKGFPENIGPQTLDLVQALLNLPEASKFIKKDINDAFNDARFFSTSLQLLNHSWLSILKSWSLADKEKMPELLSRLIAPAAAGVLGIGANSSRLEADRKTQLNLRRVALLILSSAIDTYVINLSQLHDKIIDLLHATTSSSPSSISRSEIYMVIRALIIKTSPTHLSPFWPTIHAELFEALSTSYPHPDTDPTNPIVLLQACKLLDTLLVLGIDEFQMQEWLFITDTTDAVYYRPTTEKTSVALVDDLAQALDHQADSSPQTADASNTAIIPPVSTSSLNETRKPLLTSGITRGVAKDEIIDRLVRPFFRQLSISAFESVYGLLSADREACFQEVMGDLFDDSTLV